MAVGSRAVDRDRLWFRVGAAAVVALAVALRLRGLSSWSFWLDEAMQVDFVRRGFGQMWSALVLDGVHPPLDYVACWLWYRISPDEGWLRLLPVLWSAGAVVALLVRSGGVSAPSRSLAAAGAFATFPLAVVLGQEVRPYAAALFFAAAFDAARSRHAERPSAAAGRAAVAFGVLAGWTLYWAGLFVLFSWVLDLARTARGRDRAGAGRVLRAAGVTLLLWAPWPVVVLRAAAPGHASSAPVPTADLVLRFLGGLVADRQEDVKQPMVAAVIGAVVLAGLLLGPRGERSRTALELAALSAGSLVALWAAGHWWALRYLALALLPASRAVGFAAEKAARGGARRPWAGLAAAAALLLLQRNALADAARWARPDWRRPADYVGFMAGSGRGGPVVAADPWAYFALRVQLVRRHPPIEVGLEPSAAALGAWMQSSGAGWVVRAPRFGAPADLDAVLEGSAPWARFADADDCRIYRVEAGRVVTP